MLTAGIYLQAETTRAILFTDKTRHRPGYLVGILTSLAINVFNITSTLLVFHTLLLMLVHFQGGNSGHVLQIAPSIN